jgi:hypothetical protein
MLTDSGQIDYEGLVAQAMREAMRGVVRQVITQVAKHGLPGEHHFFISFDTNAPGVVLSKRLKERYPQEMTIVLQHRFWDLAAHADRFEVKLQFNAIPERLVIPYAAVKVFVDPSVRFGHQFDEPEDANPDVVGGERGEAGDAPRPERKRAAPRRRNSEIAAAPTTAAEPAALAKPPVALVSDAALPPASGAAEPSTSAPASVPSDEPKVISLDKFRKK